MAKSKTFVEVWVSLDKNQQSELRAEIISITRISGTAFWKWATGKSRPGSFPMEHMVTEATNKVLGTAYTNHQLFP